WEQAQLTRPAKAARPAAESKVPAGATSGKKKLSYLEAREWEQMESRVLEAEQELDAIRAEMQSPDVVSDGPRLHACYQKLQVAESRVQQLYGRWAELEAKQVNASA